jgi:hypothetical protein
MTQSVQHCCPSDFYFRGIFMPSIFDIFASQLGNNEVGEIAKKIGADPSKTRDAISMTLPALVEALGRKAEQPGGAEDIFARVGSRGSNRQGSMLDALNDILAGEPGSQAAAPPASRSSPPASGTADPGFKEILPPTTASRGSGASATRPAEPAPPAKTTSPKAASPAGPSISDILGELLGGAQKPASPRSAPSQPAGLPDIFGDLLGGKQGRVSDAVSHTSGLSKDQAGSLISILGPILAGVLGGQAKQGQLSPTDLTEMLKRDRAQLHQSAGSNALTAMLDQDGDGDFDMNDMLKLGMSMMKK